MSSAGASTTDCEDLTDAVTAAWHKVRGDLLAERTTDGHWVGELSTSALSTATAISALCVYRSQRGSDHQTPTDRQLATLIQAGVDWLVAQQNEDGGWGDTDLSYSNISTTMLVLAAWRLAGVLDRWPEAAQRGRQYVEGQGGVAGLRRRYGRDKTFAVPILANAAIAGEVSWKEVSALPFEAACVPQSWYRFMQLPVVSYAIPALVAIGQARFFHCPPLNPLTRLIRRGSVKRSLDVLSKMQPASGGYLEAVPLTSFVVMGLASSSRADHPVVAAGIRFLLDSVRPEGSWPIDTNLATWNTSLAITALSPVEGQTSDSATIYPEGRLAEGENSHAESGLYRSELLQWLLDCQHLERHPFTGANPGGWGWSDLSGAVPDADDTPGALLALRYWFDSQQLSKTDRERITEAARAGGQWLLRLQNRDGGWPTFCRGWGKLPFDRSGCDLTAHVMRALWQWRELFPVGQIERALEAGWRYLERQQRADGSWLPLWFGNQDQADEENPIYGTVKVLLVYRDLKRLAEPSAQRALRWLVDQQHADGSWGGGPAVHARQEDSPGSVEETALAVEILVEARNNGVSNAHAEQGLRWLCRAVATDRHRQPSPIGFYFAKLWYHERLYPLIFTAAALSRACRSRNLR